MEAVAAAEDVVADVVVAAEEAADAAEALGR